LALQASWFLCACPGGCLDPGLAPGDDREDHVLLRHCDEGPHPECRMTVRIQTADFDAGVEIAAMRKGNAAIGAVASFIGIVRDVNEGDSVAQMTLEHYPGMTEKSIGDIIGEARSRWKVIDALVVHRVGTLSPTDQIVLVIVASAHRGDAFAACEFIMDFLKTRAPFWKKEETAQGSRWVDARVSDDAAAERWSGDQARK
jgi:molybdopterin synthase catalytic subunit